MLTIYTSDEMRPTVQDIIASVPRLDELVHIAHLLEEKPEPSAFSLVVRKKNGITHPLDWYNAAPPYILPEETALTPENLLGLVFAKLGNLTEARALLQGNPVLLNDVQISHRLQYGDPVSADELTSDFEPFEEYRFCHNTAILHHYAATEGSFDLDKTRYFYSEALKCAPNGEYYAFTARHLATLLTDANALLQAEHLLQDAVKNALSDDAIIETKAVLCQVWMKKLVVPYDTALLETLKQTLWEVLQHYQRQQRPVEQALCLMDAAQVANYTESFAEALGYANRAVDLFRQEALHELLAQAQYRKGILLYTWAKNGNPQFFKGALEAFQEALKVFSREETPEVFADIHQYLGVVYAEIPDEIKKKSIWAGVSSASFQEALRFFTPETHPYEYAMVCNNYANALTQYPEAIHTDNREKANFYYNEALMVRTAAEWPLERAVTLLNFVENCWRLNLAGNGSDQALFEQMVRYAEEAARIAPDPKIVAEAQAQLQHLETLRQTLNH